MRTEAHETCVKCGTIFKYVRSDIRYNFFLGNYVKCPFCENRIYANI